MPGMPSTRTPEALTMLTNRRPAIVVYGAAALQGFAFTLVPALATQFTQPPYSIDARAFGTLFIPLTLGALLAAIAAPRLAHRYGMVRVLGFGIIANLIGLFALIASTFVAHPAAYPLLLADTLALGLGFGLNFTAVNELASTLGTNATRSVTIVNVLTGLGTAATPLFIGALARQGLWPVWPAVLVVSFICILIISLAWTSPTQQQTTRSDRRISRALVLFGSAAVLYAFCEGVFSSWATTFVHVDRGYTLTIAETALSGFWFALTATRLIAAFSTRVVVPKHAVVIFPIGIGATLLLLPLLNSAHLMVLGFILGGIACSIVFPFVMSLALAAMPADEDRVAGVLVAALMIGEGIGTFAIGTLRSNGSASLAQVYTWSSLVAFMLAIIALLARNASPDTAVKSSV